MTTKIDYSSIPSVDAIMQTPSAEKLALSAGRALALRAIRQVLDEIRKDIKNRSVTTEIEVIINRATDLTKNWLQPSLQPVINASGIILHTNLGRAPLSSDTISAMRTVSESYNNLEFDLNKGKRGKRSIHAEDLLIKLANAESALVVNNNAAAVLLILSALAKRKKVIIPNSQLIEIGGGFRIPDVMRQSGAKLVAIGTTNRVHLSDYSNALNEGAALILNAHHSNYKIIGFTTEPELREITEVAHGHSIPFIYDQGSGAMLDTNKFGLTHEPTIQEALKDGADIVCFSGDKLLGGPQAGIIVGKSFLIDKIKRHPLARAVRADKICLAGISATLIHYLKGEAIEKIPIWKMIAISPDQIKEIAEKWREILNHGNIETGISMIGGGSLPEESLPTFLLAFDIPKPNLFLTHLRKLAVPIIARIENNKVLIDPRTVLPRQEKIFLEELGKLLQTHNN